MKIKLSAKNVRITGDKVIIDVDDDQIDSLFRKVQLSTLNIGDKFKIDDEVFIVLDHADKGTLVISEKLFWVSGAFGDCSDWNVSTVRDLLNGGYYKKIASIVGKENIIPMRRDLTSLDGLDDYGEVTDNISLLTAAEYSKYRKVLGLNREFSDWQWLITPVSAPSNGYSHHVVCVNDVGALVWGDCFYPTKCTRPVFTLNSNICVVSVAKY